MSQALTAHLGLGYFHTAFIADHAAVLHAFVFSAETLPIRHRTKNAGAEETVALGLEGAVVDCFWFGHLTMRPLPDLFR